MIDWPWNRFREFIAPKADRFTVLRKIINEAELEFSINNIAGNRHFFIMPPQKEEYNKRRLTILVAHYDRFPGSPGANDNSAAVLILIETALKLIKDKISNWLIIFTDKEELSGEEGIQNQGAYSLAAEMRKVKMENSRFFIFDACGIGDTMLISTTADYLLKNEAGGEKLRASIKELREQALETAQNLRMIKVLLAPTLFSDDLGFLRAGVATQTITMLPSEECGSFISILRKDPAFANVLVNKGLRNSKNERQIPETWRNFNSPRDNYLKLTPEHFSIVQRFAVALCKH